MSIGLSDLTFAHDECYEDIQNYGVLKVIQPPYIFEDGTIVWYQYCTKCNHERISVEPPHIRRGKILHDHGGHGWHKVDRKHRK